jgi:hypothetical protein
MHYMIADMEPSKGFYSHMWDGRPVFERTPHPVMFEKLVSIDPIVIYCRLPSIASTPCRTLHEINTHPRNQFRPRRDRHF